MGDSKSHWFWVQLGVHDLWALSISHVFHNDLDILWLLGKLVMVTDEGA